MPTCRTTLLSLALLLISTLLGHAGQFVLFDVTFTFTQEDALNSKPSQSHYYLKDDRLNPQRPKDWTTPVDYRNGTVHLRLEVLEKPAGDQPTSWSVCYIPYKGQNHGYGCIGTGPYSKAGRDREGSRHDEVLAEQRHHLEPGHQGDAPRPQRRQKPPRPQAPRS
jgi:hypothetical protein